MPVTIYVRSADEDAPAESCPSLTFDGPRVVIGRGASCDVRLPDASVSHRHATLQIASGTVSLADEGSRNGTYVGARKLSVRAPYTLKSGELVRIGRVWLEVRSDQRPATRDLSLATKDLALALVSRAMRALGEDGSPRVRVAEGPDEGAELVLAEEGRVYVVGRGDTCDLALADRDASREHVQIVKRGSVVLVRDRGSKNGATLEGAAVPSDRDVPWRAKQVLALANTAIVLEEPAALALRSIEDADDEPLAEAEVPPPPAASAPASSSRAPTRDGGASVMPVAETSPKPVERVRPRRRIAAADAGIVVAALVILLLSLAGLAWLLRT
jgi:pSer/pThr/pTyr-binding forkhead associated (FHA) protein